LTWASSSIQNTSQAISLVSPHELRATTRHGAKFSEASKLCICKLWPFYSQVFKAGERGAKRVRNLVCGIQEDFIAILWMLSFDSVCHHFPIALSASSPRKLALPCSGTSRNCETLENHVGR
jgi:hypothetical protein